MEGTTTGVAAAREARGLVARLYAAGVNLELPPAEKVAERDDPAVENPEWQEIYDRTASRLPFQYYTEVHEPSSVPTEQTVSGDLADDIADIYRDVVSGLRLHARGDTNQALWAWVFNRQHHWGEHATSFLHALQKYLGQNDFFCA